MSRRPASLLFGLLLVAVLVPAAPGVAGASSDHEQVVDLTFPFTEDISVHWPDTYDASRGGGTRTHQATDLMVADGTPVHAVVGGTVTRAGHYRWGWDLTIDGTDGRSYVYLHLGQDGGPRDEAIAPDVVEGSTVERGQLVGYAGCSGNASCTEGGHHLHLEIHDENVRDPYGDPQINPYNSLKAAVDRGDYPGTEPDTASEEPDTSDWEFTDVPPDGVHHDDILTTVDEGWASACAEREFCPQEKVTRAQMARFLANAMRTSDRDFAEAETDHFDDDDGPYEDDINLIAEHGVAEGTGDRTFSPDREVNRAEMSKFLISAIELIEGQMRTSSDEADEHPFDDVSPDSPFAEDIATIAHAEVTRGCDTDHFCPTETVVRAQMASFLVRGLLAE